VTAEKNIADSPAEIRGSVERTLEQEVAPLREIDPEIATMSGLFYRTLRITSDEFTAAVASADDENAVLAWLLSRVNDEQIVKWNHRLFAIRLADVRPEGYSLLRSYLSGRLKVDHPVGT